MTEAQHNYIPLNKTFWCLRRWIFLWMQYCMNEQSYQLLQKTRLDYSAFSKKEILERTPVVIAGKKGKSLLWSKFGNLPFKLWWYFQMLTFLCQYMVFHICISWRTQEISRVPRILSSMWNPRTKILISFLYRMKIVLKGWDS